MLNRVVGMVIMLCTKVGMLIILNREVGMLILMYLCLYQVSDSSLWINFGYDTKLLLSGLYQIKAWPGNH